MAKRTTAAMKCEKAGAARVACKHGFFPWTDNGYCLSCAFEADRAERAAKNGGAS